MTLKHLLLLAIILILIVLGFIFLNREPILPEEPTPTIESIPLPPIIIPDGKG